MSAARAHTWHRENGIQSGTIFLPAARTAWLRKNELREKPEAIILIDLAAWREDRLKSAQFWTENLTAVTLARHPLARWEVQTVSLSLEYNTAWLEGIAQASVEILPSRHRVAQAAHILSQASLSFAVALLLLFAGPVVVLNTQDFVSQALERSQAQQIASEPGVPGSVAEQNSPLIQNEEDVFSIEIPELDIQSIVTANIDPSNEKSYGSALKKGIAHAAGTGLPGQLEENKTIYLFAHSTDAPWNIARYNAQFYGLKDAEEGQEIHLRFWGEDRVYKIVQKEIVAASDTSFLEPQTEKEQLILQTCYPPGTAWKRLVVIAEPVS